MPTYYQECLGVNSALLEAYIAEQLGKSQVKSATALSTAIRCRDGQVPKTPQQACPDCPQGRNILP